MSFSTTTIFDIPIACVDLTGLLGTVESWLTAPPAGPIRPRTLTYANAHTLNISKADPAYQDHLQRTDLVYADGIGAVWASRLLGGCQLHKMTGADWIYSFCEQARDQGWRVYILAGHPGTAQKARTNLVAQYPGLDICGAADGFFQEKSETQVLAELTELAPDVLFVGMSVPVQEKWVMTHLSAHAVRICWSVGALFDYVAGEEPRAPGWMRALPLEWLWRLVVDPTGKWRRYLVGNPVFLSRVLRDRWRSQVTEESTNA